jgi:hypothetical protein
VQATEAHRRLLKHPELAYCVVPHPLVSMSDEAIAASADAIFAEIVQAIDRGSSATVG